MTSYSTWHVIRAALLQLSLALRTTGASQAIITDDAYFYGQSPPVYPSRKCFE